MGFGMQIQVVHAVRKREARVCISWWKRTAARVRRPPALVCMLSLWLHEVKAGVKVGCPASRGAALRCDRPAMRHMEDRDTPLPLVASVLPDWATLVAIVAIRRAAS
jgi:hypothetical protein